MKLAQARYACLVVKGKGPALAVSAAARLDARLLAVDIGQVDDGSWRVIEVGDAQHTALGHIPPHLYWMTLRERLS